MDEVAGGRWGAGISPFTLSWTPGMLTGYSANLVRAKGELGGWWGYTRCVGRGGGQGVRIWESWGQAGW